MSFNPECLLISCQSSSFLVLNSCEALGIEVILGERLDLSSIDPLGKATANQLGQKVVRTVTGREIAADLLVSEGPFLTLLADGLIRCY